MEKDLAIPMKLNFFADETTASDVAASAVAGVAAGVTTAVDAAETDAAKAVDNAAKEEPTKTSELPAVDVEKIVAAKLEEFQQKQAEKQTEAEKLSKMTAEEKTEYERQAKEDDYNRRLAELTAKELRIEAHKTLTEKGLPVELLDALQYADAESCNASIAAVEKAFRAAVEKGVNDRLRGNTPKGSTESNASLTMEQIKDMTPAEIMANMGEIDKMLANQ